MDPLISDSGIFSAYDLHFAKLVSRLGGAENRELALAAALVSRATGNGDVCLDLNFCEDRIFTESGAALSCPAVGRWIEALRESPVVGRPGERRPLVLDDGNRLYLYRYWEYESQLAAAILGRAGSPVESLDTGRLQAAIRRQFAGRTGSGTDWQMVAVATALLKRFAVITGGPGTGKTTTVAKLLAVWDELNEGRPARALLAAPTGKAAARLKESLRRGGVLLAQTPSGGATPTTEIFTLHRLLKPVAGTPFFHHHAGNPLPADLMIVDEASMVDLALMAKLADALPEEARLVLIGDRDQLASVEAGSVLSDICGRSRRPGFSLEFGSLIRQLTGQAVPIEAGHEPLQDCIVELQTSYRFAAGSAIGELSRAVNRGDVQRAVEVLSEPGKDSVDWLEPPPGSAGSADLEEHVAAGYSTYPTEGNPAAILQELNRFKILCAHRSGINGVEAVNRLTERLLMRQGRVRIHTRSASPWYSGRPVLVTQNDYSLGLFNGDIGIALTDPDEGSENLAVFFMDAAGKLRRFLPYRLPEHETSYAMTVHKSQGSEFEDVLLILPAKDSPVLTRELIYTALTRARQRITLCASRAVLETAVSRRIERTSGLRDALWEVEPV
ncbi:MAG: exodeoxyribonuclease V subunit alpha [Hyphomicrobiales bacterium]